MNYEYYDKNYQKFLNSISTANMSYLLEKFLKFLPEKACVLDAGCGTGRDSKAMIEAGYNVSAFDASIKMCEIAGENTDLDVKRATFETVEYDKNSFDGIWASASLLHVAREDMLNVYDKLYSFLKDDGTLYVSYKLREEDFSDGLRSFTCYTVDSFEAFVEQTKFKIVDLEVTKDTRVGRDDELWINCFLKKK